VFNIGVIAIGLFLVAWKKKYARVQLAEETEEIGGDLNVEC